MSLKMNFESIENSFLLLPSSLILPAIRHLASSGIRSLFLVIDLVILCLVYNVQNRTSANHVTVSLAAYDPSINDISRDRCPS